jgi:hypothetical protein
MAKITTKPTIQLELIITLSESEARALDALAGYGDDAFIKAFYEVMGRHYLEPHEKGLRLLLKTVREIVPNWLRRVDDARKKFSE